MPKSMCGCSDLDDVVGFLSDCKGLVQLGESPVIRDVARPEDMSRAEDIQQRH